VGDSARKFSAIVRRTSTVAFPPTPSSTRGGISGPGLSGLGPGIGGYGDGSDVAAGFGATARGEHAIDGIRDPVPIGLRQSLFLRIVLDCCDPPALEAAGLRQRGLAQAIGSESGRREGGNIVARPISFGPDAEELYLSLYATGLRGGTGLAGASVRIGNYDAQVTYAGSQATYRGLDQINVRVSRTLMGAGKVDVHVMVDGLHANTTRLTFQ
jgi:hypothetical protein